MKFLVIPLPVALISVAMLNGCSPSPTMLHPSFGQAVKQAKWQQTANPKAPDNLEPVEGLHARSGEKAMTQYEKSFEQRPGSTRRFGILLNPGSGGGSGAGS